jgi:hypothetical protein
MRVTRLYTGDDARAHLEELELRADSVLVNGVPAPMISIPVTDVHFTSYEDCEMPWHTAGRRQLLVVLAGTVEFECATGVATAGPGDVLLAEDVDGEGHVTRLSGGARVASLGLADGTVLPVVP